MNAVMTIRPYRRHGTWVFDDHTVGLVEEPFVAGIPAMIDQLVEGIPGAEHGFRLLFSAGPFPGARAYMDRIRGEHEGNWYRWRERGMEGWLCPAMFKYFAQAPEQIYVRAEPLQARADTLNAPRAQLEAALTAIERGAPAAAAKILQQLLET